MKTLNVDSHALLDDLDAIVWEADPDTLQFSYVSRKAETILGYPLEDWLTVPGFWLASLHPEDREWAAATCAAAVQDGRDHTFEYRAIRPDGRIVWLRDIVRVVTDARGRTVGLRGIMIDVSDRKRVEEHAAERSRYYEAMIEHALDLVTVIDHRAVIKFESPSIRRLLGYEPEELIGTQGFALVHPDDAARARASLAQALASRAPSPLIELRLRHKTGAWLWFESIGHFVDTSDGLIGIVHSRDIHERKHLEEQFRQSQKMEVLGRLTSAIAHDFHNLLVPIFGFTELLAAAETPESMRADILELRKAARSAADLTRQLLSYSRRTGDRQVEQLDVNLALADFRGVLDRLMGKLVTLHVTVEAPVATTRINRGLFDQIVLNLAVNARDAMPDGGSLTVRTTSTDRHVVITVIDTGHGISEAIRNRIFEPFFTTKEPGQGTGLGLSTVFRIVQECGGHIEVDSTVGLGTTFRVFLPIDEEP